MDNDIYLEERPRRNILIVEDQRPDQVLVESKVRDLWPDCEIIPVRSIQEAYGACKKRNFDMVLLDLNLPDGFGPSSVKEIRRFERNVPIIVITGMLSDLTIYESLKNGASNIISKKQMMKQDDFSKMLQENVGS